MVRLARRDWAAAGLASAWPIGRLILLGGGHRGDAALGEQLQRSYWRLACSSATLATMTLASCFGGLQVDQRLALPDAVAAAEMDLGHQLRGCWR